MIILHKHFELVEKIEESSRILKPPKEEEYPYIPYSFESNEELEFFMQKAREVTLDELLKFSKIIFANMLTKINNNCFISCRCNMDLFPGFISSNSLW